MLVVLACSLGGVTAYTLTIENQVAALITGEINAKACVALEQNVASTHGTKRQDLRHPDARGSDDRSLDLAQACVR